METKYLVETIKTIRFLWEVINPNPNLGKPIETIKTLRF